MPRRSAKAVWQGTLKKGSGAVALGSGDFRGEYSFASRFQSGAGTNPEELIGAAFPEAEKGNQSRILSSANKGRWSEARRAR